MWLDRGSAGCACWYIHGQDDDGNISNPSIRPKASLEVQLSLIRPQTPLTSRWGRDKPLWDDANRIMFAPRASNMTSNIVNWLEMT
jgi:hypothetical protein